MAQTPKRAITPDEIPFDHKPGSPPFVENASLPAMRATTAVRAEVIERAAGDLMQERPEAGPGRTDRMEPVSASVSELPPSDEEGESARQDQEPKPGVQARQKGDQAGYIRLRIRAEGTSLSVVGAKEVEGPLVTSDQVGSGLVYEVTSGGRPLAHEWLPDADAQRSFTNIDRPEAEQGHHFAPPSFFEFTVRIPRDELTEKTLPSLEIVLHRLDSPLEGPLTAAPVTKQHGTAVTVARLHGIALESLEPSVRAELARILRSEPPA
jgi:hypothetical protein